MTSASGSSPESPSEEHRQLSERLARAYRARADLESRGGDTSEVRAEILRLRRRLREAGQLRAGDFLSEGRIQLQERLGEGGFSTVWRAYDSKRRSLVAVKVLHGRYSDDSTRRERFERGARRMASLEHPAIARVFGEPLVEEGFHYFVMEYLAGGDLHAAVLERRMVSEEGLRIVLRVAEALETAHSEGVVHRDIKPANILLTHDGRPKLTDFDLVWAPDTTGGTRTGVLGTVVYAAPEAMQEAKAPDPRTDIYSLGMTMLFVLLGKELPMTALRGVRPLLEGLELSPALRRIVARATAWSADARPPDMATFRRELEQALEDSLEADSVAPVVEQRSRQRPKWVERRPLELPEEFEVTFAGEWGSTRELPFRILVLGPLTSRSGGRPPRERRLWRARLGDFEAFAAEVRDRPAEDPGEIEVEASTVEPAAATWAGLRHLVSFCDAALPLVVDCLDVTREELAAELEAEETDEAYTFRHPGLGALLDQGLCHRGEIPIGLVVGGFEFSYGARDCRLLEALSQLIHRTRTPFVASVGLHFLDLEKWSDLALLPAVAPRFEQDEYLLWRRLQQKEEAGLLALVVPEVVLSSRSGEESKGTEEAGPWGSGAFSLAALLAQSFARSGWPSGPRGPVPSALHGLTPGRRREASGRTSRGTVSVALPRGRILELANCGLIALSGVKGRGEVRLLKAWPIRNRLKRFFESELLGAWEAEGLAALRVVTYARVLYRESARVGAPEIRWSRVAYLWLRKLAAWEGDRPGTLAEVYPAHRVDRWQASELEERRRDMPEPDLCFRFTESKRRIWSADLLTTTSLSAPRSEFRNRSDARPRCELPETLGIEFRGGWGKTRTVPLRLLVLGAFSRRSPNEPRGLPRQFEVDPRDVAQAAGSRGIDLETLGTSSPEASSTVASAWKGLQFLARACAPTQPIVMDCLDVTMEELAREMAASSATSVEDRVESASVGLGPRLLRAHRSPGEVPYSLIVADFAFSTDPEHFALLNNLAGLLAETQTQFVADVSSEFVDGMLSRPPGSHGAEAGDHHGTGASAEVHAPWNRLQARFESIWISLVYPRVAIARDYLDGTVLWGRGALAQGVHILQGGEYQVGDLALLPRRRWDGSWFSQVLERGLDDAQRTALMEVGINTYRAVAGREHNLEVSWRSIHRLNDQRPDIELLEVTRVLNLVFRETVAGGAWQDAISELEESFSQVGHHWRHVRNVTGHFRDGVNPRLTFSWGSRAFVLDLAESRLRLSG